MENHWDYFYRIFLESIVKIDPAYFELERYKDVPAIRERIYCYELYHQLRVSLKDDFKYKLHGEIDKSGHDWITELFGGKCPNPDFVVHVPGDTDNLVIIEVKRSKSHIGKIKDAILKLQTFVTKVNYYRGILLIFGPDKVENLEIPSKESCPMRPIPAYKAGLYGLTETRQLSNYYATPAFIPVHRTGFSAYLNKKIILLWHKEVNKAPYVMNPETGLWCNP